MGAISKQQGFSQMILAFKLSLAAFLLAILSAVPISAEARDVLEILKQKGLLTDQELAEAKKEMEKSQPAVDWSYRLGRGFTVATKDKNYSLNLGSRLQARYTFEDRESFVGDDRSSFRVRRAKIWFQGNAYRPWIEYKIQGNFDSGEDGEFEMEDYFINLAYFREGSLQFGQFKVPFNRQELTSSGSQQFVDRGITNDEFNFGRDAGVMVHGNLKDFFHYQLGLYNGNGANRSANDNNGHLFGVRTWVTPLGRFSYYSESDTDYSKTPGLGVGAAFVFNNKTTSGPGISRLASGFGEADVSNATVDLGFKWMGASLIGDYFWRKADPSAPGASDADSQGFLVQAGYFILPKQLEIAGRFARINHDKDRSSSRIDHVAETRGAINYFFQGHPLKLQFDVGKISENRETAGGRDRDTIDARLQFQIIF